jgi:hypothetical protein
VNHCVHLVESLSEPCPVADVTHDEFHVRVQVGGFVSTLAVYLRSECVQSADVIPALQ